MKILVLASAIMFCYLIAIGQSIDGSIGQSIVDSKSNEPIEYVSIGIVGTQFGAITDDQGYFVFNYKGNADSLVIRISMIGYESQSYILSDFPNKANKIELIQKTYAINEVTIKPKTERIVGANGFNRFQGWSGWGGLHIRKGYEMGLKIDLGDKPVFIKDINILLHRQSFDISLYRLHIRRMKGSEVYDELLKDNIIAALTNESGWAKIDLEKYNLVLKGEIALTLEWLSVMGQNEDRAMKIDDRKQDAYILFKNMKNHSGVFRWGTEANWIVQKENGPSFYLTVLE